MWPLSPPWTVRLLVATALPLWLFPLMRFWGSQPEYADRILIVVVSAGLAWRRRLKPLSSPTLWRWVAGLLMLTGGVLLSLGAFLQAQVSPRPLLLWWLWASWIILLSGVLLGLGGVRLLRRFAFPLVFLFFALPLPQRVQLPLQHVLQTFTATAAAHMLDVLGISVERQGFTLQLSHCDLNVVEACSGVRSVTALLALAAFAAYWYQLSWMRTLLLLVVTIATIASINAMRVAISGLLCEAWGPQTIQGWRHETLGLLVALLGCAFIWQLAGFWRLPSNRAVQLAQADTPRRSGSESLAVATDELAGGQQWIGIAVLLIIAVVGTAALLGLNQQSEIRAEAELESLPMQFAEYEGQELPVPDQIRALLTPDRALHRSYVDPLGQQWEVWVLFWSSSALVKGYHHPDVCWPNRGYRRLEQRAVTLSLPGGVMLPVTERLFARDTQQYLVWYWTQEGKRVWTEADERRAQLLGDSHEWVLERLWRRQPPEIRARLTVWVSSPCWGTPTLVYGPTHEFLAHLAVQLYRICPWAMPVTENRS